MSIWLQKLVLMQPRTSFGKSAPGSKAGPASAAAAPPRTSRAGDNLAVVRGESHGVHVARVASSIGRHDTSLFPRLVLGCINADFCN